MIETCVFDRLLDSIANFENMHNDCSFVVFVDMIAHTRESPDYLIDENLQHLPLPEEYVLDGDFLPRSSLN